MDISISSGFPNWGIVTHKFVEWKEAKEREVVLEIGYERSEVDNMVLGFDYFIGKLPMPPVGVKWNSIGKLYGTLKYITLEVP